VGLPVVANDNEDVVLNPATPREVGEVANNPATVAAITWDKSKACSYTIEGARQWLFDTITICSPSDFELNSGLFQYCVCCVPRLDIAIHWEPLSANWAFPVFVIPLALPNELASMLPKDLL